MSSTYFFSRYKCLVDWLFAWDKRVLGDLQSAADEASVVGPVGFGHCVFHVVLSLTH